jgi:hypothetical protein
MVSEGMVGRVQAFSGTVTLTLVSPQAGLEDAKASLEMVLKDIEHRIALAKRGTANESDDKKTVD